MRVRVNADECYCARNFPKKWLYLIKEGYNESFYKSVNKNLSENEIMQLEYEIKGIACIDSCPIGIITLIDGARYGQDGVVAYIDPGLCINCEACFDVCIQNAINFEG
jgi:ferredoxin